MNALTKKERKRSIFEVEENKMASYGILGVLSTLSILDVLGTLELNKNTEAMKSQGNTFDKAI